MMSMLTAFFLLLLTYCAVESVSAIAILSIPQVPKIWQKVKNAIEGDSGSLLDQLDEEGVDEMLPQHIWDKIAKIIEEKTGVTLPKPKSPKDLLSGLPASERAKLQPVLVPIFVEALRELTGISLDASIRWEEFLFGSGLAISELDVSIETDIMKMEKTLEARQRYKEISSRYQDEDQNDPVNDFVLKMFTIKLLTETFKDVQLPPGWDSGQMANLLALKPPSEDEVKTDDDNDDDVLVGEFVK
jgi:hypothetical protein